MLTAILSPIGGIIPNPFAHPWGANFNEFLIQTNYRKGRWTGQAAIHTGLLGRDGNEETNWGGNIYKPHGDREISTNVFVGDGVQSKLLYWRAKVAYIANPLYNLRIELGIRSRNENV